jgi:aldehyde:ferredoxin oxidoreductase
MPYGYTGRILHVDLTHGQLEVETPPAAFYRKYLGGSAMGLYYVLRDMPSGADALSPDNVLALMTGVTTGTPISGQSRINATAKSPLSGGIGDGQGGGFFPAELKFAGFDGVILRGRALQPQYLAIIDGQPSLHPAEHLCGKLTGEVDAILKAAVGDERAQILQHGPAAERGVLFSSLVSMSNRNIGRTGMGAVMAAKNLRAIVVRGHDTLEVADRAAFTELARLGPTWMKRAGADTLGEYGTPLAVNTQNTIGSLPTRNYREGQFEHAEEISGEALHDTILKSRDTCYACIIRCKRTVEIQSGPYPVDPYYGGPEYETLASFGSYCAVDNLAAIAHANMLCNAHGVDTITAGATIAFAMECFEKGIIGPEQTDGLELRFGDADAMLAALTALVTASGAFGALLAQGSARIAKVWGPAAADCLTTVKNQEAPAHMPQAKKSLALMYAVNPFGADHQSHEHDPDYEQGAGTLGLKRLAQLDLQDPPAPASFGPEKVRLAVRTQIYYSLLDTLELCQFVWASSWTLYGPAEMTRLVQAVTGWEVSLYDLMKVGERRIHMMRLFNAREGLSSLDDTLPKKFFKPLLGTGPTAGVAVNREDFEAARSLYYAMMGLDADGSPTTAKLYELGLSELV